MAEIIYMPKLSDTMIEGVVAEWSKKVGDKVASGEVIAEIETDKATMEFESFYDGVLLHIGVEKGKAAPVNAILAVIGSEKEDIAEILKNVTNEVTSNVTAKKEEKTSEIKIQNTLIEEVKSDNAIKPTIPQAIPSNGRLVASPLAKKLAVEKGIDIQAISGTGDGGRIVKRDVDHYTPYVSSTQIGKTNGLATESFTESFSDEPISQMRKTIARRLAESKFTAPHFYLTIEIDMDNAISARKTMNATEGLKISFNDLVVKAVAMSLRKHPAINSSWLGDVIRRNHHIHIGVAVAVDEGLLVPVIRFTDTKGLAQIGAEVKEFVQKAKDKKLQPSDWEGNTFTISNLGMFGIESFTAIVNPPDSCILAVGGISQVPVVKNGQVVPGNVMKVTLSCDHRVVDGALGSSFLQTFKGYLENPVMMLV
jgi:pyruvate dehydrogenase E2 component (dihydrolipoamide acetyltransferase)